jgi:hypothetical protein
MIVYHATEIKDKLMHLEMLVKKHYASDRYAQIRDMRTGTKIEFECCLKNGKWQDSVLIYFPFEPNMRWAVFHNIENFRAWFYRVSELIKDGELL